MDSSAYDRDLKGRFVKYDSACKRCGECCGANNDPCANLVSKGNGQYACAAYDNRFGPQRTVSGKAFTCVSIRENIKRGFSNPNCAYAQK